MVRETMDTPADEALNAALEECFAEESRAVLSRLRRAPHRRGRPAQVRHKRDSEAVWAKPFAASGVDEQAIDLIVTNATRRVSNLELRG